MFGAQFHSLKELDAEEVGTVTLIDASPHLKSNANIVLSPQPSDDPNDPLNWPAWKKALAFLTIMSLTLLSTWMFGGISAGFLLLMNDFGEDLNDTVTDMISWVVFTLGVGNFIWVPTAVYIGKRPIFLFTSFLVFATNIWAARAGSFGSLVASRIVGAFAASSSEGLAASISADIFFLHERGWWMGVFHIFLAIGSTLGTLCSGFIIQDLGWPWHYWIGTIFLGVDAVAIFLFFPETQYSRNKAPADQLPQKPETPAVQVQEQPEKKTFIQELRPWSGFTRGEGFLKPFFRPWPILVYPAAIYSVLSFSSSLGWFLVILSTNASVFQAPPYSMSPGINSLIYIPAFVGQIAGAYCGGALTDKFAVWRARKNNGVFEPETRLVALIIPFFVVPIGLLMYGIGVQHQTHASVPFIGFGFICFGQTAVPAITMTYLFDAYLPVAYEGMLLVNGLKQIFGFGFSYGIVPWLILSGYQNAFGTMVGIQCGIVLFALPLWYFGKRIRQSTADWKIILR